MRNGQFATMMQQQEEDEVQKLMEKEQQAMSSTLTGEDFILVQRVLSLHHFLQSYIPHNLGVASKVTTLAPDSMFFFTDRLLHIQAVFRVAGENTTFHVGQHYTNLSLLGMICTNRLMNHTESITNRATTKFSGLPTYHLRSLRCIPYYRLFGSPLCNYDCQKINSLIFFYKALLPFICNFYAFTLRFLRSL